MYQEEDGKVVSPIILTVTGLLALVLIIIFIFQIINERNSKNKYIDNLIIEYIGGEKWTKCQKVSVNDYDKRIREYSFDDGNTWQESNIYEICQNGNFVVKVRDRKEKEVGKGLISITKIDNILPTIIAYDRTVLMGEEIDLLEGVTASDNESGIAGNISYIPSKIDTSEAGMYEVTYSVYDKVGNYVTKTINITVLENELETE